MKGFTLMELLIVIAIIGILASVVFASISDVRTKARNAKIDLHVRGYALGLQSFAIKNGIFPYFSQCQETGIPVTGNGGVLGVCLGEYPDEGYGEGCGLYIKTTGLYSTFADPLLNQQLIEEMGVLPPLEPIPMSVPIEHEYLLENHMRGAMYTCTGFNADGGVNEATIRYFKIHSGQECLPGATYDNSFDGFDLSTCLLTIKV